MPLPGSRSGANNKTFDHPPNSSSPNRRSPSPLISVLVVLATIGLVALGAVAVPLTTHSEPVLPTTTTTSLAQVTAPATPSAEPTATEMLSATPTHPPTATTTRTPAPSQQPTSTATTAQISTPSEALIIGHSVEDRPISAHRFGSGAIKVVLVADIHGAYEANTHILALQLVEHFQAHPDQVPPGVSLWIIPTMNPDGLETGHRWNANGVDLNRNADTDLDGCAGNDWSSDAYGPEGKQAGAGGPFPFSEPEARAVRDFLADASIAVFYHSAAQSVFMDTCQRHLPTSRLAQAISEGSGYPVPSEGWAGYAVTGDFGDYLAGEGVAAVTVELTDHENPEFERNLAGVQSLLNAVDEILSAEATAVGARYISLDTNTSGTAEFPANTFTHPIALTVLDSTAYVLDGGRILALQLDGTQAPKVILTSGDYVEDIRVLEMLDLTDNGRTLLALDRAGDIYKYDPSGESWTLLRYDRPVRDTYDHYFIALDVGSDANYLLETTHEQIWRFTDGEPGSAWAKLLQRRDVDLSASDAGIFALTRNLNNPIATLVQYQDGQRTAAFVPNVGIQHPRQVVASSSAVYVLDRSGRRLLALKPETGEALALYAFAERIAASAVWTDSSGERIILAGRDTLYFPGQPTLQIVLDAGPTMPGPQPHDPALLQDMRGLSSPIQGARITSGDFQLPGAPRHYRLGVHEGIDFYGHTVGVPVNRRTPVRAVADGVVIRALVDYEPLTAAQADSWAAESIRMGYTPPEVLDGYRGRQVWIDHGNGVTSRYAHLGAIQPGIVEGVQVTRGQVIATVGNSGTPSSLRSQTYDVHLHLELWLGDHYVGQFLRPIEVREWLERILR